MTTDLEMTLNTGTMGTQVNVSSGKRFKVRDIANAGTHFIGMLMAMAGAAPLLVKAASMPGRVHVISMAIFIVSMILLYGASTAYHTVGVSPEEGDKRLKKLDHMMIFVLIAGTYTPICTIALREKVGYGLLALVWGIAFGGMVIKAFWVFCPKWFSSILYIAMGWVCILALPQILQNLPTPAFLWLLAGGIVYTIGGVIYALKLKIFNSRHKSFGSHAVFHLFVMGGSFCHYIVMYCWVADMAIS